MRPSDKQGPWTWSYGQPPTGPRFSANVVDQPPYRRPARAHRRLTQKNTPVIDGVLTELDYYLRVSTRAGSFVPTAPFRIRRPRLDRVVSKGDSGGPFDPGQWVVSETAPTTAGAVAFFSLSAAGDSGINFLLEFFDKEDFL